jgi:NAD(P)H-flavin reductase
MKKFQRTPHLRFRSKDARVFNDILKSYHPEVQIDIVYAIGPPIMMKTISDVTRPYGIKTIVA